MPWSTRLALTGSLLSGFLLSQTAPAPNSPPAANVVLTLRAGTTCLPGPNLIERFRACAQSEATLTIRERQKVVGRAVLDMTQQYELAATKPEFGEKVTFKVKRVEGRAQGARITLAAACAGSCKTVVKVPVLTVSAGNESVGSVTHTDSTTKRNTATVSYTATVTAAAATPGATTWKSPVIRCDKEIGSQAGCVIPNAIPALKTMADLPEIAANIRKVMDGGPHHYGDRTRGSALTRSTDPNNERDNRNAACPASRKRPAGKSCDEYPFARTNQGAAKSERRDWGWAWVPVSEQRQQGGRVSAFYQTQRVLDGDRFWVEVP
ncbi:NucA/NucB deoxyribonuclease domain-containing protein [Streptomyces sp. C]|uniref:NucA/NucB deoxyribonuclease domain-containing protein n=1 Tax=Streptomyces sp. C TaxID=253839 RepID=UPI000FFC3B09|nr:NucA/NucB deoxyribonuclease domain-containing protein [Streptomyces sp. C]